MIQITIPEMTKLNYDDIDQLDKENGGIYFLYNDQDILVYIGKAETIKSRIFQHFRGKHRRFFHAFAFFYESSKVDREIYETFLVNEHLPFLNVYKKYTANTNTDKQSFRNLLNKTNNSFDYFNCKEILMTGQRCSYYAQDDGFCYKHRK